MAMTILHFHLQQVFLPEHEQALALTAIYPLFSLKRKYFHSIDYPYGLRISLFYKPGFDPIPVECYFYCLALSTPVNPRVSPLF